MFLKISRRAMARLSFLPPWLRICNRVSKIAVLNYWGPRRIQDFFRGGLKDKLSRCVLTASSEDPTAQVTFFNKHG